MTDTETDFFASLEASAAEPVEDTMPEFTKCNVDGCSNPTTEYSGRGRRPTTCAEHKKKPATKTTRSKKKYGTDYTEGISGMLQMPAAMLGVVGMQTNNVALVADGAVIADATPTIATALNEIAQQRPEFAAALDRILQVGPYGALLTAVMPLAFQLMANHNVIPAGMMGTKSAADYLGIPQEKMPENGE